MTVALALPRFRELALVRGGWRYEGGASLATYFMGASATSPYRAPAVASAWPAAAASSCEAPARALNACSSIAPAYRDRTVPAGSGGTVGDAELTGVLRGVSRVYPCPVPGHQPQPEREGPGGLPAGQRPAPQVKQQLQRLGA